jgi:hypothetical protein
MWMRSFPNFSSFFHQCTHSVITQSHLVHVAGLRDCDQLIPVHGVVLLFILSAVQPLVGEEGGGTVGYFINKTKVKVSFFYSYVKRQWQCDFVSSIWRNLPHLPLLLLTTGIRIKTYKLAFLPFPKVLFVCFLT